MTTFWLIFGLSPNLGLSDSLSERLIQKEKWSIVLNTALYDAAVTDAAVTSATFYSLLRQVSAQ